MITARRCKIADLALMQVTISPWPGTTLARIPFDLQVRRDHPFLTRQRENKMADDAVTVIDTPGVLRPCVSLFCEATPVCCFTLSCHPPSAARPYGGAQGPDQQPAQVRRAVCHHAHQDPAPSDLHFEARSGITVDWCYGWY